MGTGASSEAFRKMQEEAEGMSEEARKKAAEEMDQGSFGKIRKEDNEQAAENAKKTDADGNTRQG